MDFNRGAATYALGIGLRAVLVGALAFVAAWVVVSHQLYATAAVLLGIAVIVVADIARQAAATDRMLGQFVDGVFAEGSERPAAGAPGLRQLDGAIGRALDRLGRARSERQRRIDYLQTLADTVSAALLVVDEAGVVELANHAARQTLPPVSRLSDLGAEAGGQLAIARYGAGEVIRLADGRAMFALVSGFATPEGGRRRLVSLQRVAGDLDAVELRAWRDLVRVLSHEIMNSLTPICSLAESSAALLTERDGDAAAALAVIARRSAGLMTFVERYREVFDLPDPKRRPVTLAECMARVDALMASLMADAGVVFLRRDEAPDAMLDIDPDLVDQALINLLKNGLDAVRGRPGAQVLLVGRRDGARVVIEVVDNGPGVAAEDVETVFVPFFSRKAGGSGIGLSLARQIALAHGGRVEYAPAKTGGAVFRLILPASEAGD